MLSYSEKIKEATIASKKLMRLPVMYRKDRKGTYNKNTASFSDGTDIGIWICEQKKRIREGNISLENKEKFLEFLSLENKLKEEVFNKQLEETIIICKECGYFPSPDKGIKSYKELSNGKSVGKFIRTCKKMLDDEEVTEETKEKINKLFELEKEFVGKIFKENLEEVKEIMKRDLVIPPSNQKRAKKENLRVLKNGKDAGHFLNHCNNRYKNNEFNDKEKELWEDFLKFKIRIKKLIFINMMYQLTEETKKLGFPPVMDTYRNNKDHVRKFSNGIDMGHFVHKYNVKIKTGDITKLEAYLFKNYLQMVKKLNFDKEYNKVKEAIKLSEELGCFPDANKKYADKKKVKKLSDGTDAGSFIRRYINKLDNGLITAEYQPIYGQLKNIDFDYLKNWMKYYEMLSEYYNKNHNLNIDSNYITEDNYPLGQFIELEKRKYYGSRYKSILQKIHEERLSNIDPNWYSYSKDSKVIIKNKNN